MADKVQDIVIYPSKAKLFRSSVLQIIGLGLTVAVLVVGWNEKARNSVGYVIVAGAVAAILLYMLLTVATVYRAVARKPAVVVNQEGITDKCSLIVTGLGLIPWHEIVALRPYVYNPPLTFRTQPRCYLVITSRDEAAVIARCGLMARLLLRFLTLTLPTRISLPESLLSLSVDDLLAVITHRWRTQLQTHHISVPPEDALSALARSGTVLWRGH